jgi:hypothetical protein
MIFLLGFLQLMKIEKIEKINKNLVMLYHKKVTKPS